MKYPFIARLPLYLCSTAVALIIAGFIAALSDHKPVAYILLGVILALIVAYHVIDRKATAARRRYDAWVWEEHRKQRQRP